MKKRIQSKAHIVSGKREASEQNDKEKPADLRASRTFYALLNSKVEETLEDASADELEFLSSFLSIITSKVKFFKENQYK